MNDRAPRDPSPGSPPVLRLPTLSEEKQPGAGLVRRAVSLTLGTVLVLVLATLVTASLVEMPVTVRGAGVLEPVRVWPVRAQEAGTVLEVLVQTGDTVARGQPVLRLDPLEMTGTLRQLEAQLRAAGLTTQRAESAAPLELRQQGDRIAGVDARLVTARAALRQRMVEYGLGADVDSLLATYRPGQHVGVDLALAEVRAAEAERRLTVSQTDLLRLGSLDRERQRAEQQQLAAQIETTRERLRRLTAAAPIRGVVLTEQIERLPGSAVRPGDLLVEVADPGEWRATLFVSERDVHRVELGDSVQLEVAAFNAMEDRAPLRGSVVHVAAEPVTVGGAGGGQPAAGPAASTGLYRVVTRLDADQLERMGIDRFRRGYTVKGKIVTNQGLILKLLWEYLTDRAGGGA